jgi:hypothetical protein
VKKSRSGRSGGGCGLAVPPRQPQQETIMVMKYIFGFSSFSVKRHFHQPTALRRVFTRLLQISWNFCCCSVVHLLEPKF